MHHTDHWPSCTMSSHCIKATWLSISPIGIAKYTMHCGKSVLFRNRGLHYSITPKYSGIDGQEEVLFNFFKPIYLLDCFYVLNELRLGSDSEMDGFNILRMEWKYFILKILAFTKSGESEKNMSR